MNSVRLTPSQAMPKIKEFCAYQERCHQDVKEKLFSFGISGGDADLIISKLIEENYLNEERFAILYAGGKFRMKQWGKIKIRHSLKSKFVSDYCIKKGLATIDADEYLKTLTKLADLKFESLRSEKNIFTKKRKIQDYLLQKGYGLDDIGEIIKGLFLPKNDVK